MFMFFEEFFRLLTKTLSVFLNFHFTPHAQVRIASLKGCSLSLIGFPWFVYTHGTSTIREVCTAYGSTEQVADLFKRLDENIRTDPNFDELLAESSAFVLLNWNSASNSEQRRNLKTAQSRLFARFVGDF